MVALATALTVNMVKSFKDLGKDARELFSSNFTFGLLNFQFKTKTENDIDVTLGGKHITKDDQLSGFLTTKLKPTSDVTLKTSIDSRWVLSTDLEVEKYLHEGLTHTAASKLETESGKKTLSLGTTYKDDHVNVDLNAFFKSRYPLLTGSFAFPVPRYKSFVLGAQGVVDSDGMKLTKTVYAASYKQGDIELHGSITDHENIDVSVYQEHKDLELGFHVNWKKATRETGFGAAVQYEMSPKHKMKVKIDQNALIGLSYKLKIHSDAKLTLCTQFDGKNWDAPSHKYGLMFEYDS